MEIKFALRGSPEWISAVELVQKKYRRVFEADAMPDPDGFVVCVKPHPEEGGSKVVACSGLSFGTTRPFFSEQYLDEPIQNILSRTENQLVSRESIMEVGSMASVEPNAGIELIRFLPVLSLCLGKQYGLITSTQQLRRIFKAVGIPFIPLGAANGQKLGEEAIEAWGRYYENEPWTGFIRVDQVKPLAAQALTRYRFAYSTDSGETSLEREMAR